MFSSHNLVVELKDGFIDGQGWDDWVAKFEVLLAASFPTLPQVHQGPSISPQRDPWKNTLNQYIWYQSSS
ncbi:hypothetical protein PGT21_013367 [Puccinia graminis f. sp. tritici]|uniref:Uncharacterized protein n=1 Tax=Puccinia graminis f. sp. tritici TaxID=56615 RepID=A0A5B0PRL3_PUCGR|nr:hypothetical protein PGT21_013367 [Puccinia graminis f. sp. tritici]